MSAALKVFGLCHEEVGGHYNAVADDVDLATLEYSRRDAAEDIFLALKLKCVTGVGAALEPCHHIILGSQNVDYLSFTFVAPL